MVSRAMRTKWMLILFMVLSGLFWLHLLHGSVGLARQTAAVAGASRAAARAAQASLPPIDLVISNTALISGPLYPGQSDIFFSELAFRHIGTTTITNVIVTDLVPSQFISITAITTASEVTITDISAGEPYTWRVDRLLPKQEGSILLRGRIDPTLSVSETFTNTAVITHPLDADPANNQAHTALEVRVPGVTFDVENDVRTVRENDPGALIPIVGKSTISDGHPPNPYADVQVVYTTRDGSAVSEPTNVRDYVAISGTAAITQGYRRAWLYIPLQDDKRDEGTESFTVRLLDALGAGLGPSSLLTVTIDDDESAGVDIAAASIGVAEAGRSKAYTMALRSQPAAPVTVQIEPDSQLQSDVAALTFTSVDWSVPQTVTLTAIDDDVAEGSHQGVIRHRATSADPKYDDPAISDLVVDIVDDDGAGIAVSADDLRVSEQGESDGYDLWLTSQPRAVVTVAVSPDAQLTVRPRQLIFDELTWQTPQSLTVSARDDGALEGDHVGVIRHVATSTDPEYSGIAGIDVDASIRDNDVAGLLVSPPTVQVQEGGATSSGTGAYSVVLVSQPNDLVTVTVHADAPLTITPEVLLFARRNWAIAQTVSVQAGDDPIDNGADPYTLVHRSSSRDPEYANAAPVAVMVYVDDNDSAGVSLSRSGPLVVGEGAQTDQYALSLRSQPIATVTVALATDGQVQGTPPVLTFGPQDWHIPRDIVVSAVDDDWYEQAHVSTIHHRVRSDDSHYDNLAAPTIAVRIADNDKLDSFVYLPLVAR